MTGEQELLLALLRGELTGTAAELDEKTLREADWDAVLKESQAQAVTLMAADALSPFGKYVTNIGSSTVTVISQSAYHYSNTSRTITFVSNFLIIGGVAGERDCPGTDGDFKGYVRGELLL